MRMAEESAGCGYLARDSDFSGGSLTPYPIKFSFDINVRSSWRNR